MTLNFWASLIQIFQQYEIMPHMGTLLTRHSSEQALCGRVVHSSIEKLCSSISLIFIKQKN